MHPRKRICLRYPNSKISLKVQNTSTIASSRRTARVLSSRVGQTTIASTSAKFRERQTNNKILKPSAKFQIKRSIQGHPPRKRSIQKRESSPENSNSPNSIKNPTPSAQITPINRRQTRELHCAFNGPGSLGQVGVTISFNSLNRYSVVVPNLQDVAHCNGYERNHSERETVKFGARAMTKARNSDSIVYQVQASHTDDLCFTQSSRLNFFSAALHMDGPMNRWALGGYLYRRRLPTCAILTFIMREIPSQSSTKSGATTASIDGKVISVQCSLSVQYCSRVQLIHDEPAAWWPVASVRCYVSRVK